ncbi:MAG: hypothetical protein QOH99_1716 [Frankiaceae bacterium]|nr:hypothetical protein [Frankiaceae bacterium]
MAEVVTLLADAPVTWWLSGGYALDEFLGFTTRTHADIDVTVSRLEWPAMHAALRPTLDIWMARGGQLFNTDDVEVPDDARNFWARERGGGPWRVQFNVEPISEGMWTYARDSRVSRSESQSVWWSGRTWCISPGIQLLWKAKAPAPKDEEDYRNVVPRLDSGERAWLSEAVRTAHSTSPWAHRLEGTP